MTCFSISCVFFKVENFLFVVFSGLCHIYVPKILIQELSSPLAIRGSWVQEKIVLNFREACLGRRSLLGGPKGQPRRDNRPTSGLHSSYYNILDMVNALSMIFLVDSSPLVPLWYIKPQFLGLGDLLRKFIIHLLNGLPKLNTIC